MLYTGSTIPRYCKRYGRASSRADFEQIVANDMVILGSPTTVVDTILRLEGVRWTPPVGQFGGLDKLGSGCRHAAN